MAHEDKVWVEAEKAGGRVVLTLVDLLQRRRVMNTYGVHNVYLSSISKLGTFPDHLVSDLNAGRPVRFRMNLKAYEGMLDSKRVERLGELEEGESGVESHRYAPTRVLMLRGKGGVYQPVVQYIAHPPGGHPAGSPIRKDMTALEMKTPAGSSWQGCERAYINAELRMVCVFKDLRDEVILKTWGKVPARLQVNR